MISKLVCGLDNCQRLDTEGDWIGGNPELVEEARNFVAKRSVSSESQPVSDVEELLDIIDDLGRNLIRWASESPNGNNDVAVAREARALVAKWRTKPEAQPPAEHHEGCDTLQPSPSLGPSQKPCNCRRGDLGAHARPATSVEDVIAWGKKYIEALSGHDTAGRATLKNFLELVERGDAAGFAAWDKEQSK